MANLQNVSADEAIVKRQDLQLNVGQSLIVHSDKLSIQRVFLEGNLSSANLSKPVQYPSNNLELSATSPGTYGLTVLFDYQSDYTVNLFVKTSEQSPTYNNATYYLSGGPFELDITVIFVPSQNSTDLASPSISPWDSFVGWMGKFGEAFPLWVKLLYFGLGLQFFAVGGLWIRRETARKESGTQRLDAGDKAFLWLDVAYKFLFVSFFAIVAIMGGELLILFILRFMFLVSLDLLSLWDLFVVGFAAGAVVIVYLVRFTLEKAFDLKPMEDD